jgi:predicted peptidase
MLLLAASVLAFSASCTPPMLDGFAEGEYAAGGRLVQYRFHRPLHEADGKRYPLLVIFHGSGAIGTDNKSQIGPLAKTWSSSSTAYVLVPQFRTRSAVYSGSGAEMTSQGTDALRDSLALIDEIKSRLPIDKVYAIGFSMGGSAVWNAIALRPGLFTAAVSVAGVPNRDALAHLGNTRLLLVHGDADNENPIAAARAAFEATPNGKVEFWTYHGLKHEFPPELIAKPKLADWLFANQPPARLAPRDRTGTVRLRT